MSNRFNTILPGMLALIMVGHAHASLEQAAKALAEGNYSLAREQLEQVEDGGKESVRWQLLDAAALAGSGKLESAESRYKRLIAHFPDNPEGYNNLAVLYARQGRFDEARELLEQAMQTSESYATVYENLSNIYFEMSRSSYAKALQMEQGKRSASLEPLYVVDAGEPLRVATSKPAEPAAQDEPQQPSVVAQAPLPPALPDPEIEADAVPEPPVAATEAKPAPLPEEESEAVDSAAMPEAAEAVEETVAAVAEQPVVALQAVVEEPGDPAPVAGEPLETTAVTDEEGGAAPAVETASPQERLVATLKRWAAAWAGQDVEGYLGSYDETFEPGRGLSLAQWQAQRRRRLARPDFIQVELSDFEVVLQGEERARVTVVQRYRSNTYRDKTRKRFRLLRRPEGWKIVSEKTIEVL